MALNILCDGSHEHAPWSMSDGVFDTAREAEYTPALAKSLATVILESLAGEHKLPNVAQTAKKLKLSHFQAIASGKQPTKALPVATVPDFAYILVLSNVEPALFRQVALPFGSRTAVNAVIRCARVIPWLAAHCLKLHLSCSFDDFVAFSPPGLCNNSQSVLCLLLDLLGWRFDKEGPKSDDFSQTVSALGVVFDLSHTDEGRLQIHNTEKRVNDAATLIDEVLSLGELSKKGALTLRGKLAFCDAFVFGRLGRVSLQEITRHAYMNPFVSSLGGRLADALCFLKERVVTGIPRSLTCRMLDTYFLFTDASFNKTDRAGFGAVLFSGDGRVISWFGLQVQMHQLAMFMKDGRETIIGELETLTVALALLIWGEHFRSFQLMIYIDNEGAKFALIRGYSEARAITSLCVLTATALDKDAILPWYSRVPSSSNIADFPSRNTPHQMLSLELQTPEADVLETFQDSLDFLKASG